MDGVVVVVVVVAMVVTFSKPSVIDKLSSFRDLSQMPLQTPCFGGDRSRSG